MPCRYECFDEPNSREVESKRVCELLAYLADAGWMAQIPFEWINSCSVENLDRNTDLLCNICKEMTEEDKNRVMYNGRFSDARKLASWWEKHQKADAKLDAQEKANFERLALAKKCFEKLTGKEILTIRSLTQKEIEDILRTVADDDDFVTLVSVK